MRYTIIILFILLSSAKGLAQIERGFAWYDKYTYELYQNKEWDKLIAGGKKSINAGYDYFYLRMRLGIAHYEKGEYRLAINHFRKALEFNSSDPLAAEYLYYSYKFSGRIMDANLTYSQHKKQLESRDVDTPLGFFKGLYTEGGFKFISPGTDEYGPLSYFHVGLQHQLGSRLNIYHGYMRVGQNKFGYDNINRPGMPGVIETKTKYVQNEYYLKATFPVTEGLQIIGSIHPQAITDSTSSYNNFSYSVGMNTTFKLMDIYLAYGASTIKDLQYQQITAGLTLYPAKNQNFYLQSAFIYHFDDVQNKGIFYQKVGLRTATNTWFELFGSFGDMKNVQELDAFYVYNVTDRLYRRIGFNGIFFLSAKAKLFVGYSVESLEQTDTALTYKNHYLNAGIQILFKN